MPRDVVRVLAPLNAPNMLGYRSRAPPPPSRRPRRSIASDVEPHLIVYCDPLTTFLELPDGCTFGAWFDSARMFELKNVHD